MALTPNLRFWTTVETVGHSDGFTIRLDQKQLLTPAKSLLILPTLALAQKVACEWRAQGKTINPMSMPLTRQANSAIDKVQKDYDAIVALLGEYGQSDLICYRAEEPEALVVRQAAHWDPLLEWAAHSLAAPLHKSVGILHVSQPTSSLKSLRDALSLFSAYELTALYDLITIPGSLIIGLAIARGHITARQGWVASQVDEEWQREHWGSDADALQAAANKARDMVNAEHFLSLLGQEK